MNSSCFSNLYRITLPLKISNKQTILPSNDPTNFTSQLSKQESRCKTTLRDAQRRSRGKRCGHLLRVKLTYTGGEIRKTAGEEVSDEEIHRESAAREEAIRKAGECEVESPMKAGVVEDEGAAGRRASPDKVTFPRKERRKIAGRWTRRERERERIFNFADCSPGRLDSAGIPLPPSCQPLLPPLVIEMCSVLCVIARVFGSLFGGRKRWLMVFVAEVIAGMTMVFRACGFVSCWILGIWCDGEFGSARLVECEVC